MVGVELLLQTPAGLIPAAKPTSFSRGGYRGREYPRRKTVRLLASLGGESHHDSLLQAALRAASLRFQETNRPDPLFIDPYAGCFVTPAIIDEDMEQSPKSISRTPPCHYRLATRFIDDKLLSMMNINEELRQIVLFTDGMDTRPFRLKWPRSSVIYDISHERVFKVASQRLEGIGAKISRTCLLIHIPVESSDLQEELCKKGFNGNRPSTWVLQGLPLVTSTSLNDILFVISSLAMKGCLLMGDLPSWFMESEFGTLSAALRQMENLFMSHGFRVDFIDYDNIARNMHLDPPSSDHKNVLFTAEQLRCSDAQTERWREEYQRIEEEGDEDGFEEL